MEGLKLISDFVAFWVLQPCQNTGVRGAVVRKPVTVNPWWGLPICQLPFTLGCSQFTKAGVRQTPCNYFRLRNSWTFWASEEGITDGESVHVVQASFVPLCKFNLHVLWPSSWTDPGHGYCVSKAGGWGLVPLWRAGVFACRTHFVSRVLGNIILSWLLACLFNRII